MFALMPPAQLLFIRTNVRPARVRENTNERPFAQTNVRVSQLLYNAAGRVAAPIKANKCSRVRLRTTILANTCLSQKKEDEQMFVPL